MQHAENHKLSLREWTRRISEEDMPVFAHTARSIAAASTDDETSIANLAHLILRDSTMTARILRAANSVFFNPSNQRINTISRAIVLLGFDVVRSMALSISLLEPLLRGIQHEHALEEMARSFHAAIQARSIAQARNSGDPEAVFVASLLSRLGRMAFWCFPYGKATELEEAYQEWSDPDKAEQAVLGFTLQNLTQSLNEEWKLSSLLTEFLSNSGSDDPEIKDLVFASTLIMSVEDGWGSINTTECVRKISEHLDMDMHDVIELARRNAIEAANTATEFGAQAAIKFIPLPGDDEIDFDQQPPVEEQSVDQQLQMDILRELTTMLHERADINAILGTIIEGIYRALHMERTVIAFISTKDNILSAKYTLGDEKERLKRCFNFAMQDENIFSRILRSRDSFWLNNKNRKDLLSLISPDIKSCLDVMDFFAMPIWIGSQGRGLIYADCKRSGRKLSMEEFQRFCHFSEYASIAFELLSIRSR